MVGIAPTPVSERLGANIRSMRTLKGISMETLGSALKNPISAQQLISYEKGTNRIPAITLLDIAQVLKCRVVDLFDGIPQAMGDKASSEVILSQQEGQLIRTYRAIPDAAIQEQVREMVQAVCMCLATSMGKAN